MKNKFFFIMILVLLLVVIINTGNAQIRRYNTLTGDCYYSFAGCSDHPSGNTVGCSRGWCERCVESELCCCEPCPPEGERCFITEGCNPGDLCTDFVCTNSHCCPTGEVWDGSGCVELEPILMVTPSSQDFGAVLVGSCSTENFQISNTGTGTLTGSASVSAPFSCDSGCDYTLTGGQSQTTTIEFCPTSEQSYSRTVTFSGGGGATATVTGQGQDPAIYYTLTVTKSGNGSGTVTGPGINCGSDCSGSYESETSVTLSANAGSGSTFAGWSGACSGTRRCTVTMDSAKTVTATFNSVPAGPYTLTVSKSGTGSGTVTSSPAGIDCGSDCSESYSSGTSVTLSANAASGSTFAGWSGECSGTGSCTVTMDSGKSVTATFTLDDDPPSPFECNLASANWGSTEVTEGTTVGMNVEGNDCTSEALSFNIYRGSTHITTIYEVFPSSSWIAEPASSTLYYFIARVVDNPSESATSNNLLVTEGGTPGYCDSLPKIVLCSQYETESDCDSNICNIDVQDSVANVDCSDPNINCECIWDDNECKGSWSGSGGVCGDGDINTGEQCDGSDWGPITGCSSFDEFTSGILSCVDCQFDTSFCTGGPGGYCGDGVIDAGETCDGSDFGSITGCSDFNDFTGGTLSCGTDCQFDTSSCTGGTMGVCGDGDVNTGEQCDGSDWGPITGCSSFDEFTSGSLTCGTDCNFDTSLCTGGPGSYCTDGVIDAGETCDGSDWGPITGCSDFNNFTGGTLSCGTDCQFDTSECAGPGTGAEVGTCIYTQYTDDNCDDGFLTFSWTVEWIWDPGCDVICQQENQNLTLQCVNGQKTVECPAQIPLPFFNIYSFVATLIIIVVIYTAIIISKKKKLRFT